MQSIYLARDGVRLYSGNRWSEARPFSPQPLTLCRHSPAFGGVSPRANWGRPHNLLMRLAFLLVQLLDGFETTADNVHGALPRLIESAGFEVRQTARYATVFGSL